MWLVVKNGRSCLGIKKRKNSRPLKRLRVAHEMKRGREKGRGAKEKAGPWKVGPLHGSRCMRGGHEVF